MAERVRGQLCKRNARAGNDNLHHTRVQEKRVRHRFVILKHHGCRTAVNRILTKRNR
jgi:hypothetical protein